MVLKFSLLHTLHGHRDYIWSVAFSADGQMLASGSGSEHIPGDQTIRLWNVQTGQELRTLRGHWKGISSVAFSPGGQTLASGGGDGTIKLWNVQTGQRWIPSFKTGAVGSVRQPFCNQLAVGQGKNRLGRAWRREKVKAGWNFHPCHVRAQMEWKSEAWWLL